MVCEALRKHAVTPAGHRGADRRAPDGAAGRCAGQAFAKAGADLVSFHPEASAHVDRTLQLIKAEGCQAGLVFNPATPLTCWRVIDKVDLVLMMSVNPGFGGQSFIQRRCARSRRARSSTPRPATSASRSTAASKVDNIRRVADAGADTFVAGSAIFGQRDYRPSSTCARGWRAEPGARDGSATKRCGDTAAGTPARARCAASPRPQQRWVM